MPKPRRLVAVLAVVAFAVLGSALPAQIPIAVPEDVACLSPVPKNPPPPALTPWFYERDSGELVWGRHRYYEDPANTVFSLAKELVTLPSQTGVYPEVLLFNFAQFDPPEGINTAEPRRVMFDSLWLKGIQHYVNYSNALIAPGFSDRYFSPTFFLSLDGHKQNVQTDPPVPWSGLSYLGISATRASFGCLKTAVTPHGKGSCDDLYVTAGLGYGLADLDPDPNHQAQAAEAQTDRLLWRDPANAQWSSVADEMCPTGPSNTPRIPASATAGNNSGVAFADFTGDGWADLYIGKQGDNYLGAPNVLLVNNGSGCFTDQTATRIPNEPSKATNDVQAIDLDGDTDLDIVVANRCRRTGACGAESEDYVLINDSVTGTFTVVNLNPAMATDTRSAAVGDLNHDGWPDIVFGNAGSDGFSNNLVLAAPAEDHPMEIYVNWGALGGTANTFLEVMAFVIGTGTEVPVTAPLTQQVLLVDLFSPNIAVPCPPPAGQICPNQPDGWLDLVIVNHRDILKHDTAFSAGSRVYFMVNMANWSGAPPFMQPITAFPSDWVKTAAIADFDNNGFADVFQGRGNRFSGALAELAANKGTAGPAFAPWNGDGFFIDTKSYETMPGTEHGYGFDFADADADGALDALQTSRGYDYFVFNLLGSSPADHRDLTGGGAYGTTSNKRGQLIPKGQEDGVFADFDRDGDLDALMASQRNPSVSWPACPHGSASPDTMLLVNTSGWGDFGYSPVPGTTGSQCPVDDGRINMNGRTEHPSLADRAVAGDLDNDGDVDALIHLFPYWLPGQTSPAVQPVNPPNSHISFGFRFLRNVFGESGAGGFWMKDEAFTRMKNSAGVYDPNWNRSLGMDVLADFDNNGALDFYTTVGFAQRSTEMVNVAQTHDLLFMNGTGVDPKGVLREASATLLPAPCQDAVQDTAFDPQYISCGSFGLAQGDIDNDGDADAVVTHYSQSGRTNYPWLLVNRLSEPVAKLVDEFQTRVPIASLSPVIHTPPTDFNNNNTLGMDYAMFPVLVDLDKDGDNDLVYQVVKDQPRVLLNAGKDSNGDGLITAADTPPPGTFTDATATVLKRVKPTTDSQDLVEVDVDRDGDFDLANDPFSDMVTFWRNDLPADNLPAVTEIWPRVGSVRRKVIRLEGVNLTNVVKVQFRLAGGAFCEQPVVTPVGTAGTAIDVLIPHTCPLGLAQVRVLRQAPGCADSTTPVNLWSRLYKGYFIQG